ncbi:hypothetical protein ABKW33_14520 [Sanguibacter sp. 26GB23]
MFGSFVAGIVLAVVWRLIWGRSTALPVGWVSGFTLAAVLLALLGEIVTRVLGVPFLLPVEAPVPVRVWYVDNRFAVPVLLGILGVALLAIPVRARGGRGAAELTRRSLVSFARARWFVAPGTVLALVLLLTILAGAASEPDPTTGRYTAYSVDLGQYSMGTSIYGWFYSVPAMISVGILLVVAIVGMSLVARPALAEDRELDIRVRTVRTRNIVTAATGALLLHLGQVFSSLAATASIRSTMSTSEGPVSFWTTFSALQPALVIASLLCAATGVALWASVALSAVPSRRQVPVAVEP